MPGTLFITGEPAADELLNSGPLALLIGMLLDERDPKAGHAIGRFGDCVTARSVCRARRRGH